MTIRLGYQNNVERFKSSGLMNFFLVFDGLVALSFIMFQFQTYYILTFALQSFLLGLFLNLTYYLPYLAAISVFTFYSYDTWKSLEEKYFLLKLIIFEECLEKNPDAHHGNETAQEHIKLHSVVPKEIYESIREKLLPYGNSFVWIVLKLLWLLVLSLGVLEVVHMLHTFNTSAAVKVVATASLGILPYIFNTISWNAGGADKKEAWKKELKENVKNLLKTIPNDQIVLCLVTIEFCNSYSENSEPQNPEIGESTPLAVSNNVT